MIIPSDLSLILLHSNPFNVSPPENPKDAKWADMRELQAEFDMLLGEALTSSVTQVVLNRGPVGGGKTHAALYYSLQENWPSVMKVLQIRNIHSVYVRNPKETGKADEQFFTETLEQLRMSKIQEVIATNIAEVGEDETLSYLRNVTGSEELGHALWLLGTAQEKEKQTLLRAYFLDGCSRAELRKLGIARNITTSQDRFRVLAGVLRCFIGLDPNLELSSHTRICLWIDEMDDLVYFTAAQYRPFTQGLRELVDRLPVFFTLFMNFTLSAPEEYEEIEVILGRALIDRITNVIYFPELELEGAIEYVRELLGFYRTTDPGEKGLPPTYPFQEEALRSILEDLERRTPRAINKWCRNAIAYALQDNRFPKPGEGIIDVEYARKMNRRDLDREFV